MKLSELIVRVKLDVPSIGVTGMTNVQLTVLLNQGCDEVNLIAKIYKGYTDFDTVANQEEYALSVVAPKYLGISKAGVWVKDANGNLSEVFPRTEDYMNEFIPNWRSISGASFPEWYWQDVDIVRFYPVINTATTAGVRIYHLKKSNPMSNDDHYPWSGDTVEIGALRPMDDTLIDFVRWKLSPAKGEGEGKESYTREDFLMTVRRAAQQVKRRPDLTIDHDYRIRL